MSFKNFLGWYQLSQTNLKKKIYLEMMKFHKIWEISAAKISVFKVIVSRKLIIFQGHIFKY